MTYYSKARRNRIHIPPEENIGTIKLNKHYESEMFGAIYDAGSILTVSRTMRCPNGTMYYKVFGTKVWLSSKDVINVDVRQPTSFKRYTKVYSAT